MRPPLALAIAIDTSGSMREGKNDFSKLQQAMAATEAILNDARLSPNDLISIIQFDDDACAVLPLSSLGDRQNALTASRKLNDYSGGTKMAQGMMVRITSFRASSRAAWLCAS